MTAPSWSKSVTTALKLRFPSGFERIFDHCLKAPIDDDGHTKRAEFAIGLRYVHPTHWFRFPESVVGEMIDHSSPGGWRFDDQLVHSRRLSACTDLRHSSDTHQPIRVTFQHEFLKRAHLFQVALLCRPKDTLSQVTHNPMGFLPVDSIPIRLRLGSICQACCLHLTFPLISLPYSDLWVMYQDHVSHLSVWALPYLSGYGFPWPFGWQPSLLGPSRSHWGVQLPLQLAYSGYRPPLRPHWGYSVSHGWETSGEDAFFTAGTGCPFPWFLRSWGPSVPSSSFQPFAMTLHHAASSKVHLHSSFHFSLSLVASFG